MSDVNSFKDSLYYAHCSVPVDSRNVFERDFHQQNCFFYNCTQINKYKLKPTSNAHTAQTLFHIYKPLKQPIKIYHTYTYCLTNQNLSYIRILLNKPIKTVITFTYYSNEPIRTYAIYIGASHYPYTIYISSMFRGVA